MAARFDGIDANYVLFLVRFVQRLSGAAVDLGFGNEGSVLHRHVLRRVRASFCVAGG